MAVGVGIGEGIEVGAATTVGENRLTVAVAVEPTEGVETADALSRHPASDRRINNMKTRECSLMMSLR